MDSNGSPAPSSPTSPARRIHSLDVLRGLAVLGILTMNIVAMGMVSPAYFSPLLGAEGKPASSLDHAIWQLTDLSSEGAFRTLFSMLFGAGIVLFTTGDQAKSGRIHYRRTFWLLMFGLFDAYVLLWHGDILVFYAVCGAILYWLRNWSAKWLFVLGSVLLVAICLLRLASVTELSIAEASFAKMQQAEAAGESVSTDTQDFADSWVEFRDELIPGEETLSLELEQRTAGYESALEWHAGVFTAQLISVLPLFLLWDALVMMIFGMALFKIGVLDGSRSSRFCTGLVVCGFSCGLAINLYEAWWSHTNNYSLLSSFIFIQPTYDLGRLGLGLGYLGIVLLWCRSSWLPMLRNRLAAVGRMALTNYLMHSLIALILFTGAGFGLAGDFARWQLVLIMLAIWAFQLWFSPWWLASHRFGPAEQLWRRLTYGRAT